MNNVVVVDASVAVKWFRKTEEDAQLARTILKDHLTGILRIIVPSSLFIEVVNAIATNIPVTRNKMKKGLSLLFEAKLDIVDVTQHDLLLEASMQARKYHTSVYDMLYAVVAKEHKVQLITADEKFIEKTRFPFIAHIRDLKTS